MKTTATTFLYGMNGNATTTPALADIVIEVLQEKDVNYIGSTDIGPCSPYRPSDAPCDCLRCQFGHITRVQYTAGENGVREMLLFTR